MIKKALFLDRDGIINVDRAYVYRQQDIVFVEGIFDVIREFVSHDYLPVIVTNQSGIGRGRYQEKDFVILMQWMQQQFSAAGLPEIPVYFCPHHPTEGVGQYRTDCTCRKPEPGMLLSAITDHQIDPAQSVMIGDSWRDIQAAEAARVKFKIFVNDTENANEEGIGNVNWVKQVKGITPSDLF